MDIEQLRFDINNYQNRSAVESSYLELCNANETIMDSLREAFQPLEARERGRSRRALHAMKYSTYGKTMVGVPRGFVGKLLPYMEDMEEASNMLIKGYADAMPKYSEALSELLQSRTLPALYAKPINDAVEEQSTYTTKLNRYFKGDKEWIRLHSIAGTQNDLGLIYSAAESEHTLLDESWLTAVEHDVAVNTTYMRSINSSLSGTSDANYKRNIRKAGAAGYGMAKLVELIAVRAWETTSVLRTVKDLRTKTISDLL